MHFFFKAFSLRGSDTFAPSAWRREKRRRGRDVLRRLHFLQRAKLGGLAESSRSGRWAKDRREAVFSVHVDGKVLGISGCL